MVLNDPVNLMSYVVMVFKKVLGFDETKARKHMLEVHEQGPLGRLDRRPGDGRGARLHAAAVAPDRGPCDRLARRTADIPEVRNPGGAYGQWNYDRALSEVRKPWRRPGYRSGRKVATKS